ncbi:putative oxidoreductase DltE [Kitasatospora indigofera]|uniref:Oxidoreductase DltE n=1 Tax=Kitasatospora indigofera TaxID=67307 RepID=A0A919FXD4_9ACTN|nr:SDR family NAD(P)-dependent oxidoreductase [Kitasatospora indigofera]GHH73531.1 putative oxidoreductase DltE [Kitasatospora indigofera]
MHMNVREQRILVTGGTSGVGRALAAALASGGAEVVTCGRREGPAAGPGARIHHLTADLAVPGEAARVVHRAAERLGGLDVVVANAGVQHLVTLTGGPDPEVLALARQEIAVNLTSVVELAPAAWPHLAAAGRPAAFVGVTSGLAYAPKRSAPVYCAGKAGLHILLESLRHQARADTPLVRVQEVVLPLVDTAMTAGREGPARKISPEAAARAVVRGLGGGRAVVPVGAARVLLPLVRLCPPVAERILRDG